MKELITKLKNLPWIKIAPYGGVLFGVILFLLLAVTTYNDTLNKRKEQGGLTTRFPTDTRYFFDDATPDSGIVLSWYDNTMKLETGKTTTIKLSAQLYPVILGDSVLEYTSSDPDCAEIDNEGNITAKKPGSVEITVSDPQRELYNRAYLQVIQPVEGFYIENSAQNLYLTDTGIRIVPVIYPESASNKAIKWYSKDSKIVEVDQTGYLKPISTGMAEVVATTADGGYSAKCFVNVINETIKVESVNILNKDKIELTRGESIQMFASVFPQNARNKLINWQSADTTIATVTQTGVIKGIASGETEIIARSNDGAYDSFKIKVKGSGGYMTPVGIPNFTIGGVTYTSYNITLNGMAQKQMQTNPVYNDGNGLKSADLSRTMRYLDPNEFSSGAYKYQFMDLSQFNGINRNSLATFLDGKGILSGKADTFIAAAKQYGISELYLVAHACLETGYGTSRLATGVTYNGVRVYNMFGIGAYDSDAVGTGSKKAYAEGWTTPEAAIYGGAAWISKNYINSAENRQNTLYKMRWNPDNPGNHLYAGDIAWAITQSTILERLFAQFSGATIHYEIPVYMGEISPVIDGMMLRR